MLIRACALWISREAFLIMLRHCDTQVSRTHHRHNEEKMLMSHWFAGGKIKPSHRQEHEEDE